MSDKSKNVQIKDLSELQVLNKTLKQWKIMLKNVNNVKHSELKQHALVQMGYKGVNILFGCFCCEWTSFSNLDSCKTVRCQRCPLFPKFLGIPTCEMVQTPWMEFLDAETPDEIEMACSDMIELIKSKIQAIKAAQ